MTLTVLILTFNEERHISRAISSVSRIADRIVLVDSGSTDNTVQIAGKLGAEVLQNSWINYSAQFNWGLDHLSDETEWIMRFDADEIVSTDLAIEIAEHLPKLSPSIDGVYVSRRMTFLRRPIKWGGVFPVRVLRLFRHGRARCENRWMDEHIRVSGDTAEFEGEILDDNCNSLTWWTAKHNSYANREVVDLLNLEHGFMVHETVADIRRGQQAGIKRWLKERIYAHLPRGFRALGYFLYRYIFRLGFLDGWEGAAFHVLQGFWYRYLVDIKLREVKKHMQNFDVDVVKAVDNILDIQIDAYHRNEVDLKKGDLEVRKTRLQTHK